MSAHVVEDRRIGVGVDSAGGLHVLAPAGLAPDEALELAALLIERAEALIRRRSQEEAWAIVEARRAA